MNQQAGSEVILFDKNNIVKFDEFKSQLEKLKADSEHIIPDLTTRKGIEAEKSYIYQIKKSKAALDRVRKSEGNEALEYKREIDRQAGEIRAELEIIIDRREKPLKEIEEKEAARVSAHEQNMLVFTAYKSLFESCAEVESAAIKLLIDNLQPLAINDSWEEFQESAYIARDEAVKDLVLRLEQRVQIETDRAELQQLKYENEAREAQETADREVREAREQAERDEQQRKDQEEVVRVQALNNKMLVFTNYKTNSIQTTTVDQWQEALQAINSIEMTVDNWQDFLPAAMECQKDAVVGLEYIIKQRTAYDATQAELKRLQDEKEEQKRQQVVAQQKADDKKKLEEDADHLAKIHLDITLDLRAKHFAEDVIKGVIKCIANGDIRHLKIEY